MCLALTCSDSSSLMFVRPSIVAFTVDRIFSWVLIVGIRSQTWNKHCRAFWSDKISWFANINLSVLEEYWCIIFAPLTCNRFVRIRLSVHCLATSLASRVTSSEALAMSLAHWIRARLFPLPPRTRRDISAMSRAMRLAAPMMSLP